MNSSDTQKPEAKRVLCYGCKKPIHISRFSGAFHVDGEEAFFCESLPCLMVLADLTEAKEQI